MKKTLLALIASASLISGAQAADTNYNANDVLVGFRSTDSEIKKAYIVNLGQFTNVANYTSSWGGINLETDLLTVFGNNWSSTTQWGMVSISGGKKYTAASTKSGNEPTVAPEVEAGVAGYLVALNTLGGGFNNLVYTPGDSATAGLLTEGVWGTDSDISWYDDVNSGAYGVGPFEASTTEDISLFVAYGPTAAVGLRNTTQGVNSFNVSDGTLKVVPEPSTYALFGLAALILIVAYRRAKA
jgi:hypothetical protein